MTCYIRHNDNPEHKVIETEWNIKNYHPAIDNLCIVEIEISGVELKHTAQLLNGLIRPPNKDKILWQGDLARLIWGLVSR